MLTDNKTNVLGKVVRLCQGLASALALALAVQVVMLAPAVAQPLATYTGGGTDNDWNNPANWSTGTVPNINSVLIANPGDPADIITADASITGTLSIGD